MQRTSLSDVMGSPVPLDTAARRRTRARARTALAAARRRWLSPQRLLIAAHYLEGVQYETLAEVMNIPLGTVKTHLYRAKKRLRELLDA